VTTVAMISPKSTDQKIQCGLDHQGGGPWNDNFRWWNARHRWQNAVPPHSSWI